MFRVAGRLQSSSLRSPSLPSLEWRLQVATPWRRYPSLFLQLGKAKLTALVVATTLGGFALGPASLLAHWPTLAGCLGGTALCSLSANSLNQWAEAPFDAQMGRTRGRPLPAMRLTPLAAMVWAGGAGFMGTALLAATSGWIPAGLAAMNVALYAAAYTPMKRVSVLNTWMGSVVGAIPPLIGWYANTGLVVGADDLTAWLWQPACLAALLYCWQFPHFNALSWNLRADYARAGYCMASLLQPNLNGRVALRHAVALIPVTLAFTLTGLCSPWLSLTAAPLNGAMVCLALRFKRQPDRSSSRRLFFFSLIYLPALMTLLFIHRNNKE